MGRIKGTWSSAYPPDTGGSLRGVRSTPEQPEAALRNVPASALAQHQSQLAGAAGAECNALPYSCAQVAAPPMQRAATGAIRPAVQPSPMSTLERFYAVAPVSQPPPPSAQQEYTKGPPPPPPPEASADAPPQLSTQGAAAPAAATPARPKASGSVSPAVTSAPRSADRNQRERMERLAASSINKSGVPPRDKPSPAVQSVWRYLGLVAGTLGCVFGALRRFYSTAPIKLIHAIFGACLAFFGGSFPASLAAVEAFRNMGLFKLREEADAIVAVWREAGAANAADNALDADADGVPDVQQMAPSELLAHKVSMVFAAVKQPVRAQRAVGTLLSAWLAVLATIKFEFAASIAIGVGLANYVARPFVVLLAPQIAQALGSHHHQWIPVVIETVLHAIGITIALTLQTVVTAMYAAVAGGLLCSRSLFELALIAVASEANDACRPGGLFARVAGGINTLDDTLFDEAVGFAIAFAGFLFQLLNGFELPFPENLLLLPLLVIEWLIQWQLIWLPL